MIGNHAVVDPYNGMIDIFTRLLRGIHDQTFRDDPTRIMRLARYSGRLRFPVEPATRELAVAAVAAGAIQTISADRMRQELELTLEESAWDPLTLLAAWGVLFATAALVLLGVVAAPSRRAAAAEWLGSLQGDTVAIILAIVFGAVLVLSALLASVRRLQRERSEG